MIDENQNLLFSSSPAISLAGVTFQTRVAIQYFDLPLLEVVRQVALANNPEYTTKIPIFAEDGTELAVAKGAQLYPTVAGVKAGIVMRHEPNLTVCEMGGGRPIFEMRRKGAAAISTTAELYTNDGAFLRWTDDAVSDFLFRKGTIDQVITPLVGGGLRVQAPGGGTVIMAGGARISADVGILIGNATKRVGGVGIHLRVP